MADLNDICDTEEVCKVDPFLDESKILDSETICEVQTDASGATGKPKPIEEPSEGLNWKENTYKNALCLLEDYILSHIVSLFFEGCHRDYNIDIVEKYLESNNKTLDWWETQPSSEKIKIIDECQELTDTPHPCPDWDETQKGQRETVEVHIDNVINAARDMYKFFCKDGRMYFSQMNQFLKSKYEIGNNLIRLADAGETGDYIAIFKTFYWISFIVYVKMEDEGMPHNRPSLRGTGTHDLIPGKNAEDFRKTNMWMIQPMGKKMSDNYELRIVGIDFSELEKLRFKLVIEKCEIDKKY